MPNQAINQQQKRRNTLTFMPTTVLVVMLVINLYRLKGQITEAIALKCTRSEHRIALTQAVVF